MKHSRKIIAFLMIIILVWVNFFIVILNAHLNSFEDVSDEDMECFMSQPLVEIHIIPETVSHQGMYIKMINNFDYDFSYGFYMRLYVRHWNRWKNIDIQDSIFFAFLAYILPANSYVIEFIDLNIFLGNLGNGEYRLVREFGLLGDRGSGFPVAGAFTLSG